MKLGCGFFQPSHSSTRRILAHAVVLQKQQTYTKRRCISFLDSWEATLDVFSCIHTKMYSFLGRIVQFETVQPFPAASLKIWTQTLWSKRSYHLLSLNPLNTTIEGKQPSQAVKPRYRNHLTYLARNVETRCCKKGWCITKNTHSAHFMKLITFYSMIELESLRTLLHQYKCMA